MLKICEGRMEEGRQTKKAAARSFSGSLFCVLGLVGGLFAQLGKNKGFDFGVGRGAAFGAKGLIAFSRLAVHPAGKHNLSLVFILVFRPSLGVCSGGAGSGSGHGFTSLS